MDKEIISSDVLIEQFNLGYKKGLEDCEKYKLKLGEYIEDNFNLRQQIFDMEDTIKFLELEIKELKGEK